MAYDHTKLELAEQSISGQRTWRYTSSDSSTAVSATGYFAGAGAGGKSTAYPVFGMRLNDAVMVVMTSGSTSPGRTLMSGVIGSTANQGSTSGSTGFAAGYDVSIASS